MRKKALKVRIRMQDPYYTEKLGSYLRKHCADTIILQDGDLQDAVRDEYIITDDPAEQGTRRLALCFEDSGGSADTESISALQPADRIVDALLEMADKESAREAGDKGSAGEQLLKGQEDAAVDTDLKANRFVCVYSPQGGSGKTTFAMTFADLAARQDPDRRILYWMMEEFPEWEEYFESNSRFTMSDGIYWFLMGEKEEFGRNLERIAVRQRNGLFFIRPCRSYRDLMELTDEQIRGFTALLAEAFDLIICDMGTSWEGVNHRIVPLCGRVFLLYRDTAAGSRRLEAFLNEEENSIPGRITLIQTGGNEPALLPDAVILPRSPGLLVWEAGQRIPDKTSEYYELVREFI